MEIITMSDIGNVRTVNQDYIRFYQKNDQEALVVLCDGMGGHNAGDIASKLTCDDIIENYMHQDNLESETDIRTWMNFVIHHAHTLVNNKSHESKDLEGMGTTVVLALIKNQQLYVSHVGDSRAYWYQNEQLTQLTKDDTLVNVLVESGTISKDEAMHHPQKNILLQAIGVSDVLNVSFHTQSMQDGIVLLCSDGLYNSLYDSQMIEILNKNISLEKKGREMMESANLFGGYDNIGFALIVNKGVVNNESNQ